ncbi:MAG: hypothetical protein LBK26_01930, partial [Rickettsiales bacterium]|nr:hypothetical protein [Rickettsiales bacterium]
MPKFKNHPKIPVVKERIPVKPYILLLPLAIAACNHARIKPGTMDKNETVYALRGGYSMKHAIKENLEKRGFVVKVGKSKTSKSIDTDLGELENIDFDTDAIPAGTKY